MGVTFMLDDVDVMNISNTNFEEFFTNFNIELKDYDRRRGFFGSISPEEAALLLARVEKMQLSSEAGMMTEPTTREGNMVFCGRSQSYVDRRLTDFATLFGAASRRKRTITFG